MSGSRKVLPEEVFLPEVLLFECDPMYIGIPKKEMSLFQGTHAHEGYEFIIPLTEMPFMLIGDKCFYGSRNRIFPINPNQSHGVSQDMLNNRFLDIMIDSNFIGEIAERIFKVKRLEFSSGSYTPSRQLQNAIAMYIEEGKSNAPGREIMLESMSYNIAIYLLRELASNASGLQRRYSEDYVFKLKDVMEYINSNYKTECTLKQLADIAELSPYHFIRVFKQSTGKTPGEYLLEVKLEQSKSLLARKDMSILEVCLECGFNNVSHFTRIFKKRTGFTPSAYRAMLQGNRKLI